MALEAVVVQQDLFNYNTTKDLYNLLLGNWSYEKEEECYVSCFDVLENQTENFHPQNWSSPPPPPPPPSSIVPQWVPNSSSEPDITSSIAPQELPQLDISTTGSTRPKRRRSKSKKNKEEIENQRMTHIAVERNRRKQMNEYLSVLRGLMPESYVQRGDQASIIGGAINYVKELEQKLQSLGGRKHMNQKFEAGSSSSSSSKPFSEFFTFPQYSMSSDCSQNSIMVIDKAGVENQSPVMADIEVTMVESHANLKIRSKKRPKQLMKIVCGLQCLRLTILHLNVSTVAQVVLYSISVKVEDDCKLTTLDEIATAVNEMLSRIHHEAVLLLNN
ncbi:Transcription factor bHLH96 [Camellia lanceoleosa]|uniref:Transcription factor bHLH96 n=1 Tax=Camellia lanceoleosa TaxID=1840588 RepID=A0ACC0IA26_9ERIC|nr:Transcription factor bHLH96 [Camellia lanceoleosa]